MKNMWSKMLYRLCIVLFIGGSFLSYSQEEDIEKMEDDLKTSKNFTWDGNKNLSENDFVSAEVAYRKAIAKSPANAAAPYNLGNAYYNKETYSEAFGRFKEAGERASTKAEKHKAYHNMGNVFMKRKDYAKAVEAYKEALRNNPKDEETRYNLALAKELLKKDEDNKDQDQQDNQDDQDEKEKENNQDKDGENEDKSDQDQDQKEEGDEGDQKEQEKDENKEGDGDEKKEQNKKPEEGESDEQQPPRPNQLSKQQIENLLRAMQNAEKQVQEKIDAKKVKGAKVKTEKDW